MSVLGKNAPVVLAALLVLGTAAHFLIKGRLEARFSSDAAERGKLLTELRSENRRLRQISSRQTVTGAETPALPELPVAVRQMNAATELLKTGLFGPFAWTRGENSSIADELSALADALGLSAAQKMAMQSAAENARKRVVAAVLANARVQINENSVRGPPETREEAEERSRKFEGASPVQAMGLSAHAQSKKASSRGEREVFIEIPALPEARAAFDAMQASCAQIMGPDIYAFYQAVGAAQTIEGMFNELGLQPHWLSLTKRVEGTVAAGAPANSQDAVYEFHPIRSMVTFQELVTRAADDRGGRGGRGGGGGGSDVLSGVIQSGVSMGSSQPITRDALREAMGPLQSLIPPGF